MKFYFKINTIPLAGLTPLLATHLMFLRRFSTGLALLKSRKLLRIEGADGAKFLQGLTTNNIEALHNSQENGQYTAFLNAQVRTIAAEVSFQLHSNRAE